MQLGGCSGHYASGDPIIAANGNLGPQFNCCAYGKDVRDYNILPQPPRSDQCSSYNKDLLRDAMLNHEAIFKHQINELHHLYGRQRELMGELLMKKRSSNCLPSQMQCDTSQRSLQQIPYGFLSNPADYEPFSQGWENFQKHCIIISGNSTPMGNLYSTGNNFKELGASSSREDKFRKRLLDLKPPAALYMDSDKREQLEENRTSKFYSVPHDQSRDHSHSSNKSTMISNDGASTVMNLVSKRMDCEFDLNEPVQVDESANSTSSTYFNMIPGDAINQDHPPERLKSCVLNEIVHDIPEQKGGQGSSFTSSLQVSFFGQVPVKGYDSVSQHLETARSVEDFIDLNKHQVFTTSMTSSSFLDPLCNEINTSAFDRSSRPASGNTWIKRECLSTDPHDATSPSLGSAIFHANCSTENHLANKYHSMSSNFGNLDSTLGVDLDLNVMPFSSFPKTEASQEKIKSNDGMTHLDLNVVPSSPFSEMEVFQEKAGRIEGNSSHDSSVVQPNELGDNPNCDKIVVNPLLLEPHNSSSPLSALTSVASPSSSSENGVQNHEQNKITTEVVPCNSSPQESEKCDRGDIYLGSQSGEEISMAEASIHLPFTFSAELPQIPAVAEGVGTGINKPHGFHKEPFPPREQSEENQDHLEDSNEILDRIAAEIIISMSLPGRQQYFKNCTSGPSETSVDYLDWFAGIVSSATSFLENDSESDDTLSDTPVAIKHGEAKTFKSMRTITGTSFCNTYTSVLALPCQHHKRKIRAKNAGKKKKLQVVVAPKHMTVAAKNLTGTVKGKRGKRLPSKSFTKVDSKRKCIASKQQLQLDTDENEQCFMQSWLFEWGKKNRRQRHKRATKWRVVT